MDVLYSIHNWVNIYNISTGKYAYKVEGLSFYL